MTEENTTQPSEDSKFLNKENASSHDRSLIARSETTVNVEDVKPQQIKLYFKRWIIIVIYLLVTTGGAFHWVQYVVISNIIARYYNVTMFSVQWTYVAVGIVCFITLFPVMYITSRSGLRKIVLLVAVLSGIGNWMKYFATSPDRFFLTIISQIITAPCILTAHLLPTVLASHWFGENEVSTAAAIGYYGMTFGLAFSTGLTPLFIQNHQNLSDIELDMRNFFLGLATTTTVITIITILWLDDKPKYPPSQARHVQMQVPFKTEDFLKTLKNIFRNKSFHKLWNTHGIGVGYLHTVTGLMNPFIMTHFENAEKNVSVCAVVKLTCGILGLTIFGRIVDNTRNYKGVTVFLYMLMIIAEVLYATALNLQIIWLVYISWGCIGFSAIAHLSVTLDVCVEITFPEPEAYSNGILILANKIYATVIALIATQLAQDVPGLSVHIFFLVILIIGVILTMSNKFELRRQAASEKRNYEMSEIAK